MKWKSTLYLLISGYLERWYNALLFNVAWVISCKVSSCLKCQNEPWLEMENGFSGIWYVVFTAIILKGHLKSCIKRSSTVLAIEPLRIMLGLVHSKAHKCSYWLKWGKWPQILGVKFKGIHGVPSQCQEFGGGIKWVWSCKAPTKIDLFRTTLCSPGICRSWWALRGSHSTSHVHEKRRNNPVFMISHKNLFQICCLCCFCFELILGFVLSQRNEQNKRNYCLSND